MEIDALCATSPLLPYKLLLELLTCSNKDFLSHSFHGLEI